MRVLLATAVILLGLATPAPAETLDEQCVALVVYHEARGEVDEGQRAIAHVVVNRQQAGGYGTTLCEVVHKPGAFSSLRSGRPPVGDAASWQRAMKVAIIVVRNMDEYDPSCGATHYDQAGRHPWWARKMVKTAVVGQHAFYRKGI